VKPPEKKPVAAAVPAKPAELTKPAVAAPEKTDKSAMLAVPAGAGRPQAGAGPPKAEAAQTSTVQSKTAPAPVPGAPAPAVQGKGEAKAAGGEAHAEKQAGGTAAQAAKKPGLEALKEQVRKEAHKQRKHPQPHRKREEAVAASALPEPDQNEQSSKEKSQREMAVAAAQQAQQEQNARNNAEGFKQAFRALVAKQNAPQSEEAVKQYAEKPPVEGSTAAIQSDVAQKQSQMVEPLQRQLTKLPDPDKAKKAVDVPPAGAAPAPGQLDAKLAAPQPRAGVEAEMRRHSARLDGTMEKNRLSDDQLAESREPSFLETLEARRQAQQKIAAAPDAYRKREDAVLHGAQSDAGESLAAQLHGMGALNNKARGGVFSGQRATESRTEKRQAVIKGKIDGIYNRTVDAVDKILKAMAKQVTGTFTVRLDEQSKKFNVRVRERISEYYGDYRIDDTLFGPAPVVIDEHGNTRRLTLDEVMGRKKVPGGLINPDVYRIFREEKETFLVAMDDELNGIAHSVEKGLSEAAAEIQHGETDIDTFKRALSGDELEYATQLEGEVRMKFANLRDSIDAAREDLLQALADQYTETVNQLETAFNEINDELKKGWLDRAVEFIETVGRTIYQLAELLLSILSRLAHLVWDIIKHPIRFFETLVSGLGQGIVRFIGNFGTYLQEAFWTWITGATPAKNLRLSASSGIESLFDLVLQVLDLGPARLRAIVEKVFGRQFMAQLDRILALGEKAIEPLTILLTKGPVALWEHMREMLGTLITSTFERIKESVFFALIEKGLKWIAGFFVPGGGFVKVVKAIFSAFQFVAQNLKNIRSFFDSVFDSMEAAVQGHTDGVASKIIVGLKAGIVLALDFLAKQLGLDKIVDDAQKIIQSLRRPIVSAIEWLLTKIKPFVMKLVATAVKAGKKVVAVGRKAVARARNWWRARKPFTSDAGEPHTLYFEGSEASPRLMIQSDPQSYRDFINGVVVPADKKPAKTEALGIAGELDQAVARAGRARASGAPAAAGAGAPASGGAAAPADPSADINLLLDRLAAATAHFMPRIGGSTAPVYGPLADGFGTSVRVERLAQPCPGGSSPSIEGPDWLTLKRRYTGEGTTYIRGHLLNDHLGGPGNTWTNLTPLSRSANSSMSARFEEPVKTKVLTDKRAVHFVVTANYGRTHPLSSWVSDLDQSENPDDRVIADIIRVEQKIPQTIQCEADILPGNGPAQRIAPPPFPIVIEPADPDHYQLGPDPIQPFYVDAEAQAGNTARLQQLGMTQQIAQAVISGRPASGYRRSAQLVEKGADWDKACSTKGLRVRIYRRKSP
jgi:hypothetical protein